MWKQKGKVLQLVTGARPPCPTLVGSGYQQVGDRNSLPRTSLVAFHRSTSGCDALFISISLEFAFKIFFFFPWAFPSHLFPGWNMKACNILLYARWAVGRDGSAGELAKASRPQPLSSSCNTSVWLVLKYQHRSSCLFQTGLPRARKQNIKKGLKGNTRAVGFALHSWITCFQTDVNSAR